MPQALQKWTARMVPHDQQVAVASPGVIKDELVLDSIAIDKFIARLFAWAYSGGDLRDLAGVAPAPHYQPENDVPHPHDFDEFGFTNTKPCCMSVSW